MILIRVLRFLRSLELVVFLPFLLPVFDLVVPIFLIVWVLMSLSRVRRERFFLGCYSGVSYVAQEFSQFWEMVNLDLPQCLVSSF